MGKTIGKPLGAYRRPISLAKLPANLSVRPPACFPDWKIIGKVDGQHAGKLDIPTTKDLFLKGKLGSERFPRGCREVSEVSERFPRGFREVSEIEVSERFPRGHDYQGTCSIQALRFA